MRKTLVALTLSAALAAGRASLLEPLWTVLSSFWSDSSPDAGCGWDPNGTCNPQPAPDIGCGMDPNGCPQGS